MASAIHGVSGPVATGPLDIPIACSLSAADQRARGEEVAALFGHAVGMQELSDGYGFSFPAETSRAQDLLDFVVFERACCPFFTFDLTFPAPHEVVWLRVRGGEGVKDFVRDTLVPRLTVDPDQQEATQ
jgi:hypothetical protein